MLLVRLPVNNRLLVIKFWGVKTYMWIFDYAGGLWPLTPALFKGNRVCRSGCTYIKHLGKILALKS